MSRARFFSYKFLEGVSGLRGIRLVLGLLSDNAHSSELSNVVHSLGLL